VLQSMLPWSSTFAPEDAAARSHTPPSQAAMVETVTP